MTIFRDFQQGVLGHNQADFGESRLNTERSDQERALGLQSRGQQEQYGGLLRAQMMGQGPSVAGQQLAQGRDAAVRAAMTAAASARGANVGLAGRAAAMGASGATMQSARDAAVLRAQEQLAAQQQYGALLQAQRQQDLLARGITSEGERAQLQAGSAYNALAEKAGEANAANAQKAYGGLITTVGSLAGALSDVRAKQDVAPVGGGTSAGAPIGYTPWWLQPAQPNLAYSPGQLDSVQKQLADQESVDQFSNGQAQQQTAQSDQKDKGNFISNALQSFGGAISSDPETKTGAAPQQHGALVKAAAAVQPYSFRYRPDTAAEQGVTTERRVGVMANGGPGSLESNPVYAPAVSVGPDGYKRVDSGQATMANIAVTSDLAKKVEEQGAQLAALRKAYHGAGHVASDSQMVTSDKAAKEAAFKAGGRAVLDAVRNAGGDIASVAVQPPMQSLKKSLPNAMGGAYNYPMPGEPPPREPGRVVMPTLHIPPARPQFVFTRQPDGSVMRTPIAETGTTVVPPAAPAESAAQSSAEALRLAYLKSRGR